MQKFIPKNYKYKKLHKGSFPNKIFAKPTNILNMGSVMCLKVLSFGRLTNKELVSFYNCVNKIIKKNGKLSLCVSSYTPITKKPIETRMGKGKGNVSSWITKLKPGFILCKINVSVLNLGIKALIIAKKKLSLKTRIILY